MVQYIANGCGMRELLRASSGTGVTVRRHRLSAIARRQWEKLENVIKLASPSPRERSVNDFGRTWRSHQAARSGARRSNRMSRRPGSRAVVTPFE
jgi:hypothetical protein